MANWCSNFIEVYDPSGELRIPSTLEDVYLLFDRYCEGVSSGEYEDISAFFLGEKHKDLSLGSTFYDLVGSSGAYVTVLEKRKNKIITSLESRWSPINGLCRIISELFPSLEVKNIFYEPGNLICGESYSYLGASIVIQPEFDTAEYLFFLYSRDLESFEYICETAEFIGIENLLKSANTEEERRFIKEIKKELKRNLED